MAHLVAPPARRPWRPPAPAHAQARVPRVAVVLVACLALYAAFGKGFAYAGYPPVFVGEVLLAIVLLATVRARTAVPRSAPAVLAAALAGLALAQATVDRLVGADPLLETLRGLAPIYYCAFAFGVYALLREHERRVGRPAALAGVERALARLAPVVLVPLLVLAVLLVVAPQGLLHWPGSGAPALLTKSTDIAVTLVLLLPVLAGSRRPGSPASSVVSASPSHAPGRTAAGRSAGTLAWARSLGRYRLLLGLWFLTAVLVTFRSRGALAGLVVGLLAARPQPVRVLRAVFVTVALLLALYASGISLQVANREVSARAAVDSVVSMLGGPSDDQLSSNYVGTKEWRTEWWGDIWHDVVTQRHVLHGTGWGDNQAVRYGVVSEDEADDLRVLRLPHNVFFSLAGRAGVVTAVGFLAVLALTVAHAFRSPAAATRSPAVEGARGAVAAAAVVALSDIYLESPQGAILVWSLVGFLWWATARGLSRGGEP